MIREIFHIREIASAVAARVELYSKLVAVEAKIEKSRLVRRAVWLGVGAVAALFPLLMVHVTVMAWCWDDARMPAVLALLAIDAVLAAIGLGLAVGRKDAPPFATTTRELAADLAFLKEST